MIERDKRRRLTGFDKESLIKKQSGRCFYCNAVLHYRPLYPDDYNRDPHWACVDHVIPWINGGATNTSNCVVACRSCNARKHTKNFESFRVAIDTDVAF